MRLHGIPRIGRGARVPGPEVRAPPVAGRRAGHRRRVWARGRGLPGPCGVPVDFGFTRPSSVRHVRVEVAGLRLPNFPDLCPSCERERPWAGGSRSRGSGWDRAVSGVVEGQNLTLIAGEHTIKDQSDKVS